MPLVRFEVRNEVGLGDPDLYGAGKKGAARAEAEEPKALLEGVAVAGLVGILRQLGDLAEFAADVFHDLHEQVISTSARGRKVLTRVQNIEAALPSLEKAVKNQKSHIHFAYVPGSDWHAQLQNEQNHMLSSDLPRFMMDSYEECRDPPRLYLLDKFDSAGVGACLKRYSDPSYFKKAWDMPSADKKENLKREKRSHKFKRKGSQIKEPYHGQATSRHRSGELQRSHTGVQLTNRHFASPSTDGQSFSEHRSTSDARSNPDNISRSSSFSSKTRLSFVEQATDTKPSVFPHENGHEKLSHVKLQKRSVSSLPILLSGTSVNDPTDSLKQGSPSDDIVARSPSVKWDEKAAIITSTSPVYCDHVVMDKVDGAEPKHINLGQKEIDHGEINALEQQESSLQKMKQPLPSSGLNHHDEISGEADNYLDAFNTLESETETEAEFQTRNQVIAAPSFNAIAPQVDIVDNVVSEHPDSSVAEFTDTFRNSDMPCTSERTTDIPGLFNEDPLEVSQVAFSDHTAVLPQKGPFAISNVHESDAEGSGEDSSELELQIHTAVSPDRRPLGFNIPESKAAGGHGGFPNISGPELSAYSVIPSNKDSSAANQIIGSEAEDACGDFTDETTNYCGSRPTSSDILTDNSFKKAFTAKSSPGDTIGDSCVVSESKSAHQDDPGKNHECASEVSDFQSESLDEPLEDRCASASVDTNSSSTSIVLPSVKLWTNAGLFGLEPSKPPAPVFGAQDGPMENSEPGSAQPEQVPLSDHSPKPTELAVVDASNGNTSITSSFVGKLVGICPGSANANSSGVYQSTARKPDSVHSQTDGPSGCSSSFEHNEHKNLIGKHTSISELLESEENAENGAGKYSNTDIDGRNNMHMVSASSFSSIAQRFLANTLQRRTSPKYNDISASGRANTDASASDQSTLNHVMESSETVLDETQFEKSTENGTMSKSSIFSSRCYSEKSSPPLEYMEISFHPMSSFKMSKMNLDLCDGNFNENSDMMLPTFQLFSESSIPQPGSGSESEDDTFGRSYSYSSYDDLSPRLYSNSEVWDQEDGVGLEEHELYDDLNQSAAPISSYIEFEQMNLCGTKSAVSLVDQDVLGTLEPHNVEELPNFDTLMSRSDNQNDETSISPDPVILPLYEDQLPPPPPLPPMQWRAMRQTASLEEEKGTTAKDMFRETSSLPHVHTSAQEGNLPPVALPPPQGHAKDVDVQKTDGVNGSSGLPGTIEIQSSFLQQIRDKSEQLRLNGHEKSKAVCSNIENLDEREELLQQIRSKTFNLRRTNASKTDTSSQSTANSNVVAILEKANAIRQAVASEDGCDDDNWSDI